MSLAVRLATLLLDSTDLAIATTVGLVLLALLFVVGHLFALRDLDHQQRR